MLMERDGHKDFVKVLDFGLALMSRHISDEEGEEHRVPTQRKLTEQGEIFGTPAYMAPEQTIGGLMDIRTDLYALGIIFYELLTGERPFDGESTLALIQQHLSVPPPPMKERARAAKVPADLEALVLRLLAKQPEQRFQKPKALLAALDEVAAANSLMWPGGTPISTLKPPAAPSPTTRASKPAAKPTAAPLRARLATAWALAKSKVVGKQTRRARLEKALTRLRKRLPKPLRALPLWLFIAVPAAVTLTLLVAAGWMLATRAGTPSPAASTPNAVNSESVKTRPSGSAAETDARDVAPADQHRAPPPTDKKRRKHSTNKE